MYQIDGHRLLQYPGELEDLITIFADNGVKSYLEIGCKYGGSLWKIGSSLPKGSRIVAVDLMRYIDIYTKLQDAVADLARMGYQVLLIKGDSTDPEVIRDVLEFAPFDACLIDGDHSLEGVRKDWNNYGPMCKMVAFHDINWSRPQGHADLIKYNIAVPGLWNKIKTDYRHVEIKKDKRDNGIGVLWR